MCIRSAKRILNVFLFLALLVLAVAVQEARALPSYGNYGREATTFGIDQQRDRFVMTSEQVAFWALFKHNFGNSYSQPLILSGERWGIQDPVIVALGGNKGDQKLRFWRVTEDLIKQAIEARKKGEWLDAPPYSESDVVGFDYIRSDATAPEFDPCRFYFGNSEGELVIVDASDLANPKVVYRKKPEQIDPNVPRTTDIVSAPLVVQWRGHTLVVTSMGNAPSGQGVKAGYYIWADPGTPNENVIFLPADASRTSSSPGLVGSPESPKGFYAGADNGYGGKGKLFYWEFDRILAEQNGRVVGVLRGSSGCSKFPTLDSVITSPCVDGDTAYFADDKGNAYAVQPVYGKNGISLEKIWTYYNPEPSFSHHSPALSEYSLYVPLGTKLNMPGAGEHGRGALLRVDRATGEGKIVASFYGYVGTAPLVWIRGSEPTIWIGTQGMPGEFAAALARIRVVNGQYIVDVVGKILNPQVSDPYGRGFSGGISEAFVRSGNNFFSFLAVTGEAGIGVWMMQPFDASVVSIDPGIPAGEKAKAGQRYTAKVVFEIKKAPKAGTSNFPEEWEIPVPVGAFHQPGCSGTYYSAEIKELSKERVSPENNNYVWYVKKEGDTIEVTFDWTAPNTPKTKLAAGINTLAPPVDVAVEPEDARLCEVIGEIGSDRDDNWKEIEVPIEGPVDVAVSIKPTASEFTIPWTGGSITAGAIAEVFRKDSGDKVPVKVTIAGPGGTKTYDIELGGGARKTFGYTFQVSAPGTYTVRVEAWPVPQDLESYPPDNVASCQVVVEKMKQPPASTQDVHVEIGGGGGTGGRSR